MKKIVIFSLIALLSIGSVFEAGTEDSAPAQKTVTVFGAFVDEEARRFEEAIRPFEERTGIKVVYEGSKDFETLINVRVEGGNAPRHRRPSPARPHG